MNPKLLDELFVHCQDRRVLFLNPIPPDWITINEKYRSIFDRFDGTHSEEQIIAFIETQYEDESAVLVPQIKNFVHKSKLLTHNFQVKGEHRSKSQMPVGLPKYVYLTLTDRCNLQCRYCYAVERIKNVDASFETWSRYIQDVLTIADKPVFIFTGGEPLIVPFVYELAGLTNKYGCENILLTNGTQIDTPEKACKIAKLFSLVKISLDSLDDRQSEHLRAPGIRQTVQNAFDLLKSAGANVQILATVTSITKKEIDDFAKHFDNQVNFQPFYKMGRARGQGTLAISGKEYYDALTKTDIFRLLPGFHRKIHGYRNQPFKRCAMAKEEVSIDSAGNVYPCHMLHTHDLNCGNLNETDFITIYHQSPVLRKLRNLDVDQIEQCRCCAFRNICGGACRARVDVQTNGIAGSNDFCDFEKQAILDALLYSYG